MEISEQSGCLWHLYGHYTPRPLRQLILDVSALSSVILAAGSFVGMGISCPSIFNFSATCPPGCTVGSVTLIIGLIAAPTFIYLSLKTPAWMRQRDGYILDERNSRLIPLETDSLLINSAYVDN